MVETSEEHLNEDIQILECMYPELEIIEANSEVVRGELPFTIICANDVGILSPDNNLTAFRMDKFPKNKMRFTVDPSKYPDLVRGVRLNLESEWMDLDDADKLVKAIHEEFDLQSDSSSDTFDKDFPILMMVFDFLINQSYPVIFPEDSYSAKSHKQLELFSMYSEKTAQQDFASKNFYCCICIESKKGSGVVQMPCSKHYLCRDCLKSYFSVMIKEGSINNIRCPECDYTEIDLNSFSTYEKLKRAVFSPVIPFEFFNGLLPEECCHRYKELFYDNAFNRLSRHNPYSCAKCPRCEKWCLKDDLDDQMVICTECEFCFCFICLHSWHGNNNICGSRLKIAREYVEEYVNQLTSDERKRELETRFGRRTIKLEADSFLADMLLDLAIEDKDSNLQKCPGCKTVIQRSEGCNKMVCTICGVRFCYVCATTLDPEDPYEHFREPCSPCYGLLFEGMPGNE